MRYLILSLCCVLIVSCKSYPVKQGFDEITASDMEFIVNPYFANGNKDYVYKASIEVNGNTFGGLFIVKKISTDEHRVVFTTEMGSKIFDFSFLGNDFKVNYALKEINKKIFINFLRKDFEVLLKEKIKVLEMYKVREDVVYKTKISGKQYFYYFKNDGLTEIVRPKNGNEQTVFWYKKINDNIAGEINVNNNRFDLKINLKSIK